MKDFYCQTIKLSVPSVFGFFAIWPVVDLFSKVRSRLMGKKVRHINRVLVAEHVAMTPKPFGLDAHRHVVFDKGGGFIGSRKSCADVKRLIAPKRRENDIAATVFDTLAIIAVTGGALSVVNLLAANRVGDE